MNEWSKQARLHTYVRVTINADKAHILETRLQLLNPSLLDEACATRYLWRRICRLLAFEKVSIDKFFKFLLWTLD